MPGDRLEEPVDGEEERLRRRPRAGCRGSSPSARRRRERGAPWSGGRAADRREADPAAARGSAPSAPRRSLGPREARCPRREPPRAPRHRFGELVPGRVASGSAQAHRAAGTFRPARAPARFAPAPLPLACPVGASGSIGTATARTRPAASANVTFDSGTSGSPRRTRARYSPVAERRALAICLGRALGDDLAAARAALRPEVDDPVGRLDDVEVVLDDDDRVAGLDEPVEHLEQLLDVGEVEAGRRLVEDVQGLAGRAPRQLGRELHALRLAAGQRRRRLAEVDVAEPDVVQGLELRRRSFGTGRKNSSASSTVISRTSAIERPL